MGIESLAGFAGGSLGANVSNRPCCAEMIEQ